MKDELLESIVQRLKDLHIKALADFTDEELMAATAYFNARRMTRHIPEFERFATYQVLMAIRKLRGCLPIEPGDSPFDYPK